MHLVAYATEYRMYIYEYFLNKLFVGNLNFGFYFKGAQFWKRIKVHYVFIITFENII